MKKYWDLSEQPPGETTYIWTPPWPAILIGIISPHGPLDFRRVYVGQALVACCYLDLCQMYGIDALVPETFWEASKKLEVKVGAHVLLELGTPAQAPVELCIKPAREMVAMPADAEVKFVSKMMPENYLRDPLESERVLRRKELRQRQQAELLLMMKTPLERKKYG